MKYLQRNFVFRIFEGFARTLFLENGLFSAVQTFYFGYVKLC